MHTKQHMVSPFKIASFVTCLLIVGNFISGCVSYRIIKAVEGGPVPQNLAEFNKGRTTIQQVLDAFGAPDQITQLEGRNVLIYQQSLLVNKGLSFGISLTDIWGPSFDFSAYGELVRYDVVILSFTPDGVLRDVASEKGTRYPFLKTLISAIQQ